MVQTDERTGMTREVPHIDGAARGALLNTGVILFQNRLNAALADACAGTNRTMASNGIWVCRRRDIVN
jgi:hypothetical protein